MTPEEARAKWVEALRSGEYEQGKGVLTRLHGNGSKRHCCLGVACELYRQDHPDFPTQDVDTYRVYGPENDSSDAILPDVVRDWLGLYTRDGRFAKPITYEGAARDFHTSIASTLTSLNDGGADFNKVADVIESEPEGFIR